MTAPITLQTKDGAFNAYVAAPTGKGPWPTIVVIQEIFGINKVVRDIADHLATLGYLAVAPDLFWRIEPGIDITDQSEAEWKRAFELYTAFDVDRGVEDIGTTLAAIRADERCNGKVGVVGYCLGGLLAFLTATRTDADCAVSYYGVGIDAHLAEAEKLAKPVVLHIAEADEFVPQPARERIAATLKNDAQVRIFTYPGRNHAFARVGGQHYDAADAAAANARTETFFAEHLS